MNIEKFYPLRGREHGRTLFELFNIPIVKSSGFDSEGQQQKVSLGFRCSLICMYIAKLVVTPEYSQRHFFSIDLD